MVKRMTGVVALVAVCLLGDAASAAPRRRGPVSADLGRGRVSVDTRQAQAEVDARLQRAVGRADRAARRAGVRVNVRSQNNRRADRTPQRRAVQRREAYRREFARKLTGGDHGAGIGGDRRAGRR